MPPSPRRSLLGPLSRAVLIERSLSSLHSVAVLLWTIVCLAIAAHFQSILLASDLSECTPSQLGGKEGASCADAPAARFVPFAIFVCAASMLIIIAL